MNHSSRRGAHTGWNTQAARLTSAMEPRTYHGNSLPSLISGLLLLLVLVLALSPHLVLADCECGYRVSVNTTNTTTAGTTAQYVLTDLIETNFANISDLSKNTDWVRQAFNTTATQARGTYGQMTAVENVNSTEGGGLGITVRAGTTDGMVQGGEIDTARLDVFYGTFRSSMRLTDVSGTVSAFFWVRNFITLSFIAFPYERSAGPIQMMVTYRIS